MLKSASAGIANTTL